MKLQTLSATRSILAKNSSGVRKDYHHSREEKISGIG
tara:strand:- start:113 stop:223 length:111 start_codon:yes stop_codon:yes gene_type:complete